MSKITHIKLSSFTEIIKFMFRNCVLMKSSINLNEFIFLKHINKE
jgi:hypothetical protein